ncbi:MAG: hypothetical protein BGO26_14360 [Actinobacteria bacterium 69-20]|jgi:lipoprotein-anchoring transpeptidase ErfK/SrfK|nr:L,D-transpeptidase [Actinomycetota bacterium]OJV29505.1 MAG: hypothetical protein BGO26_14360 [Actinobacteria bacterium 69-20]
MRPHRRTSRRIGLVAATVLATLAATACSAGGTAVVTTTVTPAAQNNTGTSDGSTPGAASSSTSGSADTSGAQTGTASSTIVSSSPSTSTAPAQPVHVSTFEADGSTYGVGMAVVVLFSAAPTDAAAFEKATTVTVNGQPATGAWFWQKPTVPGYQLEALYREQKYWPAHSQIAVNMPVQGLSAGDGLVYDDSLTLTFNIGAAHISQVNNAQHMMTVTSDGQVVKNLPVSLGSASTPTYDGVKVVMEKGSVDPKTHKPLPDGTVEMKTEPGDPHPYDVMVPWSVRITNSGEFIHAASWNTGNIGSRNTSHGCTNLDVGDAEWFYNFSIPGDVVEYPGANKTGTMQPSWDGWGWWNMPWSEWTNGGLLVPAVPTA